MRRTIALSVGSALVFTTAWTASLGVGSASTRGSDVIRAYVVPNECGAIEGIAVRGGKYYTGSHCDGSLYRGDLDRKRAKLFVAPQFYEMDGIKATAARLVVARGKGRVSVFNRFTGRTVARFANGLGYDSVVADVAIAPTGAAFLTDHLLHRIYRIPAHAIAQRRAKVQPLRVFLDLRDSGFPTQVPSAQGVAATPNGRFLLVGNTSAGRLYRIRLSNGEVTRVRLHGKELFSPTGIILHGAHVLYVVEHEADRVAKIRLGPKYAQGRIVSRTTHANMTCPRAVAVARASRLLVTNALHCTDAPPPPKVLSIPLP